MAFDDNPFVDDKSERSEESVLQLQLILNKKNGFICREENPDYGVDLDVELIRNGQATGNKFPIQIKSTQTVNFIKKNGETYATLQFKTSRLGYLARRIPQCGLIVLYDEDSGQIYYDFTEEIISRIQLSKKDESWKSQESVNIHFAKSNHLTKETAAKIHNKISSRYENFRLLLESKSLAYEGKGTLEIDSQPKPTFAELEEFGAALINLQDFKLLAYLFSTFPNQKIGTSPLLCLYAAITYCEIGDVIEASYYSKRCKKHLGLYLPAELEVFELIQPKISFITGDITLEEYSKLIQALSKRIRSPINIVNVKLSLFNFEVIDRVSKQTYDFDFETILTDFLSEIEKLDIEYSKRLALMVSHIDAISNYANSFFSHIIIRHKIRKEMDNMLPLNARLALIERHSRLNLICEEQLRKSFDFAIESENDLLLAEVLFRQGRIFCVSELNNWFVREIDKNLDEVIKKYKYHYEGLVRAYNIFIANMRFKEAHLSLNFALDLRKIYVKIYDREFDVGSEKVLRSKVEEIELNYGIGGYVSDVEEAIEKTSLQAGFNSFSDLAKINDEKLLHFAKITLEALDLPIDRLKNIEADLRNYRKFYLECQNPDIEMLQNRKHTFSRNTHYRSLPRYILRSKSSGIQTPESSDVDELISAFKHLLKKR